MTEGHACDEELLRRLPLPLAQLYRRAHNAKTSLDRHLAAYYLWEAALKLLGSVAVVEYAELGQQDSDLNQCLQSLARPAVGHWWEFVRRLAPALAGAGKPHFLAVQDLLLGRTRDDLPRAAGLGVLLAEALDGPAPPRSTVRLSELFDRLVRYRNREVGHGAAGQRPASFYESMGRALLAGVPELLGRLDVLAGRRLLYVAEVRRQASGAWLIDRYDLTGETVRRIEALELPGADSARLPHPERLYLEARPRPGEEAALLPSLPCLHPLVVYDPDSGEVFFLNARRGRQRIEYLSYSTGRVLERSDLAGEQRALLAQVFEAPSAADGGPGAVPPAAQPDPTVETPAQSRRLGDFELLSELGRGGMGVVYRAWQPSLGRQVALKCLFQTGDPRAEARFRREIRALGRVEHPHVVKIFTSGSEGERWFYAMELLEGATLAAICDRLAARTTAPAAVDWPTWQETLRAAVEEARRAEQLLGDNSPERLRQHPAEAAATAPASARTLVAGGRTSSASGRSYLRQVVELVRQAAEAAHALHEAGIVHRDIKPGNIVVAAGGETAVLMDLGLAQLADEVQGRLTRTREFVGTLRYASPEQVLAVGGLDRRSDVYSLGATLWEALALRPLYGAAEQTSTPELMRRIQYEEPERLRKHQPSIPPDLEAVVLKCLEKDPTRRYATARDLADDLGAYLRGEPVLATGTSNIRALRLLLQESRHTEVMAQWGRVWMAHAVLVVLFSLALSVTRWLGLRQLWPEILVEVTGCAAAAVLVWYYRFRTGAPLTLIERQVFRVWAIIVASLLLYVAIEFRVGPSVERLIPVAFLEVGIGFGCTAVILGGSFYVMALVCAILAVLTAMIPGLSPVVPGVAFAIGLLVPAWKYARPETDKKVP